MNLASYLPTTQFAVMAGALVLSGGLVVGAQYLTAEREPPTAIESTPHAQQQDWQRALEEIQLSSGISLPEAPSQELVAELLEGAQSSNITSTVAQSLFINLSYAKAQGLGDDIPTQEQLIEQALTQLNQQEVAASYGAADLSIVASTKASLKAYGNAFMQTILAHPKANAAEALLAVGYAVDHNDSSRLAPITSIAAGYEALARGLSSTPVPQTLAPLHLQVVNNFAAMASAARDMQAVVSDPVRGLSGLQRFHSLGDESARVLTTIAESLRKDGILFTKDEPGSTWSSLLSPYAQ